MLEVDEPWPMPHFFVPQNATVLINCTANASSTSTPIWSISPAGNNSNSNQLQFSTQHDDLNDLGFYELPSINMSDMITLRLLINDTTGNNQTEIICDFGTESYNTTLFVCGKHMNQHHSSTYHIIMSTQFLK